MKNGRMMLWGCGSVGALVVGLYSLVYFLIPERAPLMKVHEGLNRAVLLIHIAGAVVALVAGPVQFLPGFRGRWPRGHRRVGYVYFAGVVVGGVAGLYAAVVSMGGLVAHTGFFLLSLCWLGTAGLGLAAILRREIPLHREWLVRCYALTFAAVTLRFWLPVLTVASGSFDEAYRTVSWLSWVPNLMVAEWWIQRRRATGPVFQQAL
jgi:hypothetical protein